MSDLTDVFAKLGTLRPRGLGGRPSGCTPELTAEVAKLVADGASFHTAAGSLGVPYRTHKRWMAGGTPATDAYRDALREAGYKARVGAEVLVRIAKPKEWLYGSPTRILDPEAEDRWLEPESKVKITGGLAVAHGHIDLTALSDAQLDAMLAAHEVIKALPAPTDTEDDGDAERPDPHGAGDGG